MLGIDLSDSSKSEARRISTHAFTTGFGLLVLLINKNTEVIATIPAPSHALLGLAARLGFHRCSRHY